jgi:hypothetical protein
MADTRFAAMLEVSPLIAQTDVSDPFLRRLYDSRDQRPDN